MVNHRICRTHFCKKLVKLCFAQAAHQHKFRCVATACKCLCIPCKAFVPCKISNGLVNLAFFNRNCLNSHFLQNCSDFAALYGIRTEVEQQYLCCGDFFLRTNNENGIGKIIRFLSCPFGMRQSKLYNQSFSCLKRIRLNGNIDGCEMLLACFIRITLTDTLCNRAFMQLLLLKFIICIVGGELICCYVAIIVAHFRIACIVCHCYRNGSICHSDCGNINRNGRCCPIGCRLNGFRIGIYHFAYAVFHKRQLNHQLGACFQRLYAFSKAHGCYAGAVNAAFCRNFCFAFIQFLACVVIQYIAYGIIIISFKVQIGFHLCIAFGYMLLSDISRGFYNLRGCLNGFCIGDFYHFAFAAWQRKHRNDFISCRQIIGKCNFTAVCGRRYRTGIQQSISYICTVKCTTIAVGIQLQIACKRIVEIRLYIKILIRRKNFGGGNFNRRLFYHLATNQNINLIITVMGSASVNIIFVKIYQYIFFRRKISLYIKGIAAASRKALTLEGCRIIRMCIVSVCKPYKHIAALIAVISVYGNRNAFRICCECFGGNADAVPFRFRFYRKGCAGVIMRFIFIINIIDIRNNHIPCR